MTGQLFGSRFAKQVDYFAFPRTGSHYLSYLLTGLFDLVFFPIPGQDTPEVVTRSNELRSSVLYALKLREDGVPFQPLYLDHAPLGIHEAPRSTGRPILILIRDPRSVLYSWFRLHVDRLREEIHDPSAWFSAQFEQYRAFYRACQVLCADPSEKILMVRFEELVASTSVLHNICEFVGLQPKLQPEFVHELMRFDNAVRSDIERTFYRSGTDRSWKGSEVFEAWLAHTPRAEFEEFGYGEEISSR